LLPPCNAPELYNLTIQPARPGPPTPGPPVWPTRQGRSIPASWSSTTSRRRYGRTLRRCWIYPSGC